MIRTSTLPLLLVAALAIIQAQAAAQTPSAEEHAACAALADSRNLTITSAGIRQGDGGVTYSLRARHDSARDRLSRADPAPGAVERPLPHVGRRG